MGFPDSPLSFQINTVEDYTDRFELVNILPHNPVFKQMEKVAF